MKNVAIIYGDYEQEKKSIELLTKTILDYTVKYPVCIKCGDTVPENHIPIYIGTKETNEYIRQNSKTTLCGHFPKPITALKKIPNTLPPQKKSTHFCRNAPTRTAECFLK